ncbi:histidinol-phosphatase HisJ [Bacillus thermotolerans]|uniref:Histidinol-phosphatase n=1 Tax=Bacillus thermotolerans TaxID=1221996 RepID=A0A0F5HWB6_BACTR|nr:histidinol-phosphatase HisJ [Bacillus thermotolerans]KKB37571.1 Histidinol-phosphatase [Bacillus thermotolerans]KKB42200.1 Histidinol-phosphatase [Bacillus thermotolerans]KKB43270.1 Histidinol-phosphatase [Bacillus thermotolerans]
MKRDGHIHTPFCPHGTTDSLESYVEEAIHQGFTHLTFTEHAPLPDGFLDTTPTRDSGMDRSQLDNYFILLDRLKKEYASAISIKAGLEIDFIEGFEAQTAHLLNEYGPLLDDSILSVHFLKHRQDWYCLDYSADYFEKIIRAFGSITAVYTAYFQTVKQSIEANLGPYKPTRIGHMTLVHKFQKQFPCKKDFSREIDELLHSVKSSGYELDFNGAGLMKPLCQETYPPPAVAQKAKQMGIPLVYGSDAHQAKDIGQGWKDMPLLHDSLKEV